MADFSGFEPVVGEIRALRTFRVDVTGALLPVAFATPWQDGDNRAVCAADSDAHTEPGSDQRPHRAPDPDCTCGLYAYGSEQAAARQPDMRYVQAVVACSGRVIAGEYGIRAERARIQALWLNPSVPSRLASDVRRGYPSARVFTDRQAMLAELPLTTLDCYRAGAPPKHWLGAAFSSVVVTGLVALGLAPLDALRANPLLWSTWLTAIVSVATLTLWTLLATAGPARRSAALLLGEVLAWLLAPVFGVAGWVLRLPLLNALVGVIRRALWVRRRSFFPIVDDVGWRARVGGVAPATGGSLGRP
jgi:hypothetical protein